MRAGEPSIDFLGSRRPDTLPRPKHPPLPLPRTGKALQGLSTPCSAASQAWLVRLIYRQAPNMRDPAEHYMHAFVRPFC